MSETKKQQYRRHAEHAAAVIAQNAVEEFFGKGYTQTDLYCHLVNNATITGMMIRGAVMTYGARYLDGLHSVAVYCSDRGDGFKHIDRSETAARLAEELADCFMIVRF